MTSLSAENAGTITIGGDLTVNRLGFGAMRVTGDGIWGPPRDHDEAIKVLRRTVELGVNLIDTADSYGPEVSENLIREALYPYPADLIIATKGGLERPGPHVWTNNSHPDHLRAACEGSLRRLGLEQIPLYQWHRPDPDIPLEDAIGTLVELKNAGKIRHIGVSNVTVEQLRTIQALTDVVSVQNRYNIATRTSEDLVEICAADNVVFFPWAPMHDFADTPEVAAIAVKYDASPRQLVLAWLLAHSPAMLPIPGTGSIAHLEHNVAAASIDLEPADIAVLTAVASDNGE